MRQERCWEFPWIRECSGVLSPEDYHRLAQVAQEMSQQFLSEHPEFNFQPFNTQGETLTDVDLSDVESDADDIDYEDDRPLKEFDIIVKPEIYLRLRISARDDDEALERGCEELRGMRFKTYISDYAGSTHGETIGVTKNGRLSHQVHFDLPERPDGNDMEVEEV